MPRRSILFFALAGNLTIVGGTYLWGKYSLSYIPPLPLGLLRFSLAAILLHTGIKVFFPSIKIDKKDRWRFIILAILVVPINQLFFLLGLRLTTPAHSALMYSTLPIFIYIISLLFKEESYSWLKNSGIAIGFAGVFLIFREQGIDFKSDYVAGDLLILVAVNAWAFYTVLGRPMIRKYGAFFVNARALSLGTLMFFPFGLYSTINFDFKGVPAGAWLGILYMAVMTSIVAYTLWYWALKYLDASKVGVVNNFQPIVTAAMSFLILGETISTVFAVGGVIVFMGVYMTLRG